MRGEGESMMMWDGLVQLCDKDFGALLRHGIIGVVLVPASPIVRRQKPIPCLFAPDRR